jgi:hypothetical protein
MPVTTLFLGSYMDCSWCNDTKFGSGVAKALVRYIDGSCGGDVSVELDYEYLADFLEFTEEQVREAVALLIAKGFARTTNEYVWAKRDVLQLLTPGRVAGDQAQADAVRKKEAARAAKIALRGGQVRRAPIPESVKTFVFERDGHACQHCGTSEDLALDHVHPWSIGGPDTPDNLQILCRPCNSRKGDRV